MSFALDTLNKMFAPCRDENGQPLNPTTLLADHPLLSLTTTRGLIIWAAVQSSWSLRCAQVVHQPTHGLDEFVATWLSKLEQWRSNRGCTVPGKDMSTIIGQRLSWQVPKAMFALGQTPKGPWTKPKGAGGGSDTVAIKQQKHEGRKQQYIDELLRAGNWLLRTAQPKLLKAGHRQAMGRGTATVRTRTSRFVSHWPDGSPTTGQS